MRPLHTTPTPSLSNIRPGPGVPRYAGPVIGHVVSSDLVHWARLPVALWNGPDWYDEVAIFTGSTTIVDGKPVLIYPGLCNKGTVGCTTGFNYAQARPANLSDPFFTNWTKAAHNPILNGTGGDPSSAWRKSSGEWRLIGNARADGQQRGDLAPLFGAEFFGGPWRLLGDSPLVAGECPTLFPLPPNYPGTSATTTEPLPTHVHKWSHDGVDYIRLGNWSDTGNGTWEVEGGTGVVERGSFYASKDFLDGKGRRILWGWAVVDSGVQAIPRVITWHAELRQLIISPPSELTTLREPAPIATLNSTDIPPNHTLSLSDGWRVGLGNVSELLVRFALPVQRASFGVSVLGDVARSGKEGGGVELSIDFIPPPTANQSFSIAVRSAPTGNGPALNDPRSVPSQRLRWPPARFPQDELTLLPSDIELTVRVFVDAAAGTVETFFMDGRVVMTTAVPAGDPARGSMSLFARAGGVHVLEATAWSMRDMWVSLADVLGARI